jgi:hypothetical protein
VVAVTNAGVRRGERELVIVAAAQLERQPTHGISIAHRFNPATLGRQSGRPTHIPPLDGVRFAAPLVMYGELSSR